MTVLDELLDNGIAEARNLPPHAPHHAEAVFEVQRPRPWMLLTRSTVRLQLLALLAGRVGSHAVVDWAR
jgi:hypothetical protein